MINILWDNFFRKNYERKKTLKLLHGCHLFSNLSKKELLFIEKIVHLRHFQAGETIFLEGDVGVGLYIIKSGFVDLFKESSSKKENEKRILVKTLNPGDFFGEVALVEENEHRTLTAISRYESHLLGFFRPDLLEVISRRPTIGATIALRLSEVLGRRLKECIKSSLEKERKASLKNMNLTSS